MNLHIYIQLYIENKYLYIHTNRFSLALVAIISSLTSSSTNASHNTRESNFHFFLDYKQAEAQLLMYNSAPMNRGGVMGKCSATLFVSGNEGS